MPSIETHNFYSYQRKSPDLTFRLFSLVKFGRCKNNTKYSMNSFDLNSSLAAGQLNTLAAKVKPQSIRSMFQSDTDRVARFSVELGDLYFDNSKQQIDQAVLKSLIDLAKEAGVSEALKAQFSGEKINVTENRSVLHMALRAGRNEQFLVEGEDVMPQVYEVLDQMETFTKKVLSGELKSFSGMQFTDVVNIGIGGSDLGPAMVAKALESHAGGLKAHFVSNVDGADLASVLRVVPAATTLFIIVSKTFTTQETLANALAARAWFKEQAKDDDAVSKHFIAVSTNSKAVAEFGIAPTQTFGFWEWVGGRYSLWSAVGLSIALSAGWKNFRALLDGAKAMDVHVQEAPFDKNIPVIAALTGVWNRNFLNYSSVGVIPYSQELSRFSAYLQQADMESNGKYVGRDGKKVSHATGPVIWGEPGTNGQHAFFQLLHQGTDVIPVDFIGFVKPTSQFTNHHTKLMANCFAQAEALMNGKSRAEVDQQLDKKGVSDENRIKIAPFKVFEGNRPSSMLLFKELNAFNLGMLIALYEHKIFVQGVIWNVFSYDQWGVELGKELASRILPVLEQTTKGQFDDSTQALIDRFLELT
jgi:glucose-6-phosphate isomerase